MVDEEKIRNSFLNVKEDIEKLKEEIDELKRSKKRPFTIWFTGLPCSGKTTLAKRFIEKIESKGYKIAHLDGDDTRKKLNEDLGFSKKDRSENLRRIAHVCQLFNEKGMFVVASYVSPREEFRKMIKNVISNVKIVYVEASLNVCIKRDVKGMYKKAKAGKISKFTGISAPFEEPADPELIINTDEEDLDSCVDRIIEKFEF